MRANISEQTTFFILKRELESLRRTKWLLIIILWVSVLISQFYLNLSALMGSVYGFIIGITLATGIYFYFTKKEQEILVRIARLNI